MCVREVCIHTLSVWFVRCVFTPLACGSTGVCIHTPSLCSHTAVQWVIRLARSVHVIRATVLRVQRCAAVSLCVCTCPSAVVSLLLCVRLELPVVQGKSSHSPYLPAVISYGHGNLRLGAACGCVLYSIRQHGFVTVTVPLFMSVHYCLWVVGCLSGTGAGGIPKGPETDSTRAQRRCPYRTVFICPLFIIFVTTQCSVTNADRITHRCAALSLCIFVNSLAL